MQFFSTCQIISLFLAAFSNFQSLLGINPIDMKIKTLTTLMLVAFILSSCLKDKRMKTYSIYRSEYSIKPEVMENAKLQSPRSLKDLGSFVLYNNAMYINEKNKGIHVVDYTNPANPINKGFIPIPGNKGLSIKNNVLYADCYCDLFVFKIQSDQNITLENTLTKVFPYTINYANDDSNYVAFTWIKKDTTVSQSDYKNQQYECPNCDMHLFSSMAQPGNNNPSGSTSVGSSMAIFTIVNDYLYTVDDSKLNSFSLSDALHPAKLSVQQIGWNVETIFPFKDKLFIGSMSGMFIYGLTNPQKPNYISQFNHMRVCDPVIADDNFAFVTLRNGTTCGGTVNQLDVVNISTITSPVLLKSFPFTNPHGLSKDKNVMFVCDGTAGLKMIDASNVSNLQVKQTLATGKAIDVVAYNSKAFVMLEDAIKIYSYDQQFALTLLGTLNKN
ncbi:hypothetical protein CNR22_21510 [Sphingobacteriaceae bacterium]|nr:hypothetical protein CNR22_21510 [Sphingobacteriaceae bacterium]